MANNLERNELSDVPAILQKCPTLKDRLQVRPILGVLTFHELIDRGDRVEIGEEKNPVKAAIIFLQALERRNRISDLKTLAKILTESTESQALHFHDSLAEELQKAIDSQEMQYYANAVATVGSLEKSAPCDHYPRQTAVIGRESDDHDMKEFENFSLKYSLKDYESIQKCEVCTRRVDVPLTVGLCQPTSVLLNRAHSKYVRTMVNLRSTDANKANGIVRLVQYEDMQEDLKYACIAAGTPATTDTIGFLQRCIEDIRGKVENLTILEYRMHLSLLMCYYWSERRNEKMFRAHIDAALQLSKQVANDYAGPFVYIMKALSIVDKHGYLTSEEDMLEADANSEEAVQRAGALPDWTQPLVVSIRLERLWVELAIARFFKGRNEDISARRTLNSVEKQLQWIDYSSLNDGDQAIYLGIEAVDAHLKGNLEVAQRKGTESVERFLKVGWYGGAFRSAVNIGCESLVQKINKKFKMI